MAEVLFRAKLVREEAATPWGFRLQGGVEYDKPLTLLKVLADSLAAKGGLHPGDIVVKLAGKSADDMTHKDAQEAIISAANTLEIIVERAEVTITTSSSPPEKSPVGIVSTAAIGETSVTSVHNSVTSVLNSENTVKDSSKDGTDSLTTPSAATKDTPKEILQKSPAEVLHNEFAEQGTITVNSLTEVPLAVCATNNNVKGLVNLEKRNENSIPEEDHNANCPKVGNSSPGGTCSESTIDKEEHVKTKQEQIVPDNNVDRDKRIEGSSNSKHKPPDETKDITRKTSLEGDRQVARTPAQDVCDNEAPDKGVKGEREDVRLAEKSDSIAEQHGSEKTSEEKLSNKVAKPKVGQISTNSEVLHSSQITPADNTPTTSKESTVSDNGPLLLEKKISFDSDPKTSNILSDSKTSANSPKLPSEKGSESSPETERESKEKGKVDDLKQKAVSSLNKQSDRQTSTMHNSEVDCSEQPDVSIACAETDLIDKGGDQISETGNCDTKNNNSSGTVKALSALDGLPVANIHSTVIDNDIFGKRELSEDSDTHCREVKPHPNSVTDSQPVEKLSKNNLVTSPNGESDSTSTSAHQESKPSESPPLVPKIVVQNPSVINDYQDGHGKSNNTSPEHAHPSKMPPEPGSGCSDAGELSDTPIKPNIPLSPPKNVTVESKQSPVIAVQLTAVPKPHIKVYAVDGSGKKLSDAPLRTSVEATTVSKSAHRSTTPLSATKGEKKPGSITPITITNLKGVPLAQTVLKTPEPVSRQTKAPTEEIMIAPKPSVQIMPRHDIKESAKVPSGEQHMVEKAEPVSHEMKDFSKTAPWRVHKQTSQQVPPTSSTNEQSTLHPWRKSRSENVMSHSLDERQLSAATGRLTPTPDVTPVPKSETVQRTSSEYDVSMNKPKSSLTYVGKRIESPPVGSPLGLGAPFFKVGPATTAPPAGQPHMFKARQPSPTNPMAFQRSASPQGLPQYRPGSPVVSMQSSSPRNASPVSFQHQQPVRLQSTVGYPRPVNPQHSLAGALSQSTPRPTQPVGLTTVQPKALRMMAQQQYLQPPGYTMQQPQPQPRYSARMQGQPPPKYPGNAAPRGSASPLTGALPPHVVREVLRRGPEALGLHAGPSVSDVTPSPAGAPGEGEEPQGMFAFLNKEFMHRFLQADQDRPEGFNESATYKLVHEMDEEDDDDMSSSC